MKPLVKISLLTILAVFVTNCGKSRFEAVQPAVCTVSGGVISCPDGTSEQIPVPKDGVGGIDGVDGIDGEDGSDGQDGTDGATFNIVDPCGDGQGHDEVLIILNDGRVLAWYVNLGFTILNENVNYQTTDAQKCKFKVVAGQIVEL